MTINAMSVTLTTNLWFILQYYWTDTIIQDAHVRVVTQLVNKYLWPGISNIASSVQRMVKYTYKFNYSIMREAKTWLKHN